MYEKSFSCSICQATLNGFPFLSPKFFSCNFHCFQSSCFGKCLLWQNTNQQERLLRGAANKGTPTHANIHGAVTARRKFLALCQRRIFSLSLICFFFNSLFFIVLKILVFSKWYLGRPKYCLLYINIYICFFKHLQLSNLGRGGEGTYNRGRPPGLVPPLILCV